LIEISLYQCSLTKAAMARAANLLLFFCVLFSSSSCDYVVPKGKLLASARTCIPGTSGADNAFKKMNANIRAQGLSIEIPGESVGWKSQRVISRDGGYLLQISEHCLSEEKGLQLVFIEGSIASFSLEGWARWYAVNRTFEELFEQQVVVEKHPWVNTPEDKDVIEFAQVLDVRLPQDAIETLVERGAASEDELASIGSCRFIGNVPDYPGC